MALICEMYDFSAICKIMHPNVQFKKWKKNKYNGVFNELIRRFTAVKSHSISSSP